MTCSSLERQTKGIANVVIYLRNANRVHESALPEAATGTPVFDQKNCLFITHVQPLLTGQTLTLANGDGVSHNIKTDAGVGFNETLTPNKTRPP